MTRLVFKSSLKNVWDRGATRAGYLSEHSKKGLYTTAVYRQDIIPSTVSLCFPGTTFHCRLITQAWLTLLICSVFDMAWLYIKPTRFGLALVNRQVTQSIATQQDIYDLVEPTVWSQRGFASHIWNFDRFLQPCLFRLNTAKTMFTLGVACRPRTTTNHFSQAFYLVGSTF